MGQWNETIIITAHLLGRLVSGKKLVAGHLGGRLLAHCKGPCDPADCPRLSTEAVEMHKALMRAWAESQNG